MLFFHDSTCDYQDLEYIWELFLEVFLTMVCPGYDVKLIRCCPQYDVKLMWRHQGNDIASVAAICDTAQLIFLLGRTRLAV